jgi:ketosteroid isomerase-like protein
LAGGHAAAERATANLSAQSEGSTVYHQFHAEFARAAQRSLARYRRARGQPSTPEGEEAQVSINESVSIVLEAFGAVEQRDERRLRDICHPEVSFHWPPSLPFGSSQPGVSDSWSAVWDRVQPTAGERRMDPRVVAATEHEVVVLWRQRGLGPRGERYDDEVLGLYEVRDAALARAQMFYFDALAVWCFLVRSGAIRGAPSARAHR